MESELFPQIRCCLYVSYLLSLAYTLFLETFYLGTHLEDEKLFFETIES